jgi:O-antigen ligase
MDIDTNARSNLRRSTRAPRYSHRGILIKRPWLVYAIPFLTIYWDPIKKINIGANEFNINIIDIALLLIAISFLFKKRKPKSTKNYLSKYGITTPSRLFFLTWAMAIPMALSTSILFSPSMIVPDLMIFAKRIGEYALIAVLIPKLVSVRDIKPILAVTLISGAIVSAIAVSEAFSFKTRATSWLMYANNLGIYAVVVFNIAVAIFMSPTSRRRERLISLLSASLSFVTLVLSASRAASLGLLASMIFWVLAKWPERFRRNTSLRILMVSVMAILILVIIGSNFIMRWREVRLEGVDTPQVQARIQASKLGLRLFAHYPFLGTGISGLPQLSMAYFDAPRYWALDEGLRNAGNQFLQIAVEGGVVALFIFVYWVIKIKNLVYARIVESIDEDRLMVPKYAVRAIMLALIAAGVGMHTFYVPQIMAIVWMLIGIIYINKN